MPDHRHRVVAPVPDDLHNVPPLPHRQHRRIRAKPRRVNPDHNGRRRVLVLRPLHGVVHHRAGDELIVADVGKLPVHLDVRLTRVWPVLVNDLLVYLLVRALNCARVHDLGQPELALAVERLVEVPRVAPRVAKRQPEPVGCVLSKETRGHRPDGVVDT